MAKKRVFFSFFLSGYDLGYSPWLHFSRASVASFKDTTLRFPHPFRSFLLSSFYDLQELVFC